MQHVLNIRYANRFLAELDANPTLLAMCGLEQAPDEGTYSRFKKALTEYGDEIDIITARVATEIRDEIKRLRTGGVAPADAPQLDDYIAFDSTDIAAYGNPDRNVPADPDATWGVCTASGAARKRKSISTDTNSTSAPTPITAYPWTEWHAPPTRATGRNCP